VDTLRAPLDPGLSEGARWAGLRPHRKHGKWYPDKRRAFVVPLGTADALGRAIASAVTGQALTPKPAWLATLDANRARMLSKLQDLNAPTVHLDREKSRQARGWGWDQAQCLRTRRGPGARTLRTRCGTEGGNDDAAGAMRSSLEAKNPLAEHGATQFFC
jgi:hypothetical protein